MHIQTVHQVSDAQPSVAAAMDQLSGRLDKLLVDLDTLFRKNGGSMWGVEAISHNLLTLPDEPRQSGGGLFRRPGTGSVRYVASAMLTVSHNNDAVSD